MKKILLLLVLILFTLTPCFAKNTNTLFLVKDASVSDLSKNLKANFADAKIIDNTLYSTTNQFYYMKIYQDNNNIKLFLICDSKNIDSYTSIIKKFPIKIYKLTDKALTNQYNSEFKKFISLNNIEVKGIKNDTNAYNPYDKELSNKIIKTTNYSKDNINFISNKMRMETKIKKYVYGYEIIVTNNTDNNIILKKVSTGDFVGLTEIAKKAAIPTGVDFVPVYGIIKGAQTDLEKNKFTRPFPIDYTLKTGGSVRILGIADLQVEPIIDFVFEINSVEKTIQFNTYQ